MRASSCAPPVRCYSQRDSSSSCASKPDGDRFHMVNGANWFDRTVSADAAGIILTSLVINRQLWLYHDSGDAGLTHLYRMRDAQLWRHIEFHPECNAIYAALD